MLNKKNNEVGGPGLQVAKRTWIQYLGRSDKGSIKWIAKAKELKDFVDEAAAAIASKFVQDDKFRTELRGHEGIIKFPDTFKNVIRATPLNGNGIKRWFASPRILKVLLDVKCALDLITEGDQGSLELIFKKLEMFEEGSFKTVSNIKMIGKICAGLVDEDVLDPDAAKECLYQIGSLLLLTPDTPELDYS